ncbi:MAG: hypothetical protein ACK575_05520, partial [Cyanobacteriota bacterium]
MHLISRLALMVILGLAWARMSGSLFGPSTAPGSPNAAPSSPPAQILQQVDKAVDAGNQAEQQRFD